MVGPKFLKELCGAMRIRRLIFQSCTDAGAPPWAAYTLPARLGQTEVETVAQFLPSDEYRRRTLAANVVLAPRTREGVGLAFLKEMARGGAALGFDAPAMNEYIQSGRNGYLFPSVYKYRGAARLIHAAAGRLGAQRLARSTDAPYPVTEHQDWEALAKLDPESLGRAARETLQAGYARWQRRIPELARFITEW
jgi:glycosyltransferase involved in cell wall biosynthesis